MARTPRSDSRHLIGNRVASAKSTAEKVQEDLQVAEVELQQANRVITAKLAATGPDPELARAVTHAEQVEEKLGDAGQDLALVTQLLDSEERDRQREEQAARARHEAEGQSPAGARSGEGSASVVEHLRELTRHRLNSDPSEPTLRETGPTPGGRPRSPRST